MNNKLSSLIFTLLGTLVLLVNIVIILPIRGYLLVYGIHSLSILDMVSVMGNSLSTIMSILPGISLALFLLGIAFLGIFFHKKRGYGLLLFGSWAVSFASVLIIVIKTYTYIGRFPLSVLAGTVLVIGGFISRYACFWGYMKKQLLARRIPMLIRTLSFLVFGGLLYVLPQFGYITQYRSIPGLDGIVYTPRIFNSREILFGILFLINLWISSLCAHTLVYGYGGAIAGPKYRKRGLSILFLVVALGGIAFWSKKALFTPPVYEAKKYDPIFVKEGYQSDTIKQNNGYYRQNQRLRTHTGFLQKINKNPYVTQNYNAQSGFLMSGFTQFWKTYSGEFSKEFTGLREITQLPYAMIDQDATIEEHIGFPDERLRERTILLDNVAIGLCKTGECPLGFSYRKDRYRFLEMRLKSGPGMIQSLISLVSIQNSLSGMNEMLPHLTADQKQELKKLLIPYNIPLMYKNMLVQEYFFTHLVGIKNIQDYMQQEKVSIPKFILDIQYTDFLMKENFAKMLSGGKVRTDRPTGLVYNTQGYSLLNALLPRLTSAYSRFTALESQKITLIRQLQ